MTLRATATTDGAFGWRISSTDTRRGTEFQANTFTTGYQGFTHVAGDEVGNFVVAWLGDGVGDVGDAGIFAQRFGGLFPTALNVNTTGNRRVGTGRVGRRAADVAQPRRLAADVRRHPDQPHRSGGRNLHAQRRHGQLRDGAQQHERRLHRLLHGSRRQPDAAPRAALGRFRAGVHHPRYPGPAEGLGAAHRRQLHRRADRQPFYRFIETLLHHSVTGGCGGTNYCPTQSTTRDQMAVFVLVAKEGAGYTPPACGTPDVQRRAGRTTRSAVSSKSWRGGPWSPDAAAATTARRSRSRASRWRSSCCARWTRRSTRRPACRRTSTPTFPRPVPFCRWIEELTNRTVVSGCGGGNYCPTLPVTREQMGVFISVTFGLTLYGP